VRARRRIGRLGRWWGRWARSTVIAAVFFALGGAVTVAGWWTFQALRREPSPFPARLVQPTAAECAQAAQELERRVREFERDMEPIRQAGVTDSDPFWRAYVEWFTEERQAAEAWVAAGCPDDGVRGIAHNEELGVSWLRLFRYESFFEYAADRGIELPRSGSTITLFAED